MSGTPEMYMRSVFSASVGNFGAIPDPQFRPFTEEPRMLGVGLRPVEFPVISPVKIARKFEQINLIMPLYFQGHRIKPP
jgi:hypothetical protein